MPDCCESYETALKNATPETKAVAKERYEKCLLFKTQNTNDLYSTLQNVDKTMYSTMAQCIQNRIIESDQPLINLINNYELNKIDAVTASELNKNTMSLYQIDLYYTVGKVFIFFIIALAYYYFLNGQKIVETIKSGVQTANEKITKFTEVKAPKVEVKAPVPPPSNSKTPIK
jgi:predicted PurR-regulated permease PerM